MLMLPSLTPPAADRNSHIVGNRVPGTVENPCTEADPRTAADRVPGARLCLIVLPALLFLTPAAASAEIVWDPAWHVASNGQRYSVETFSSRLPVDVVVKKFLAEKGVFDHYLLADGRLFLSGVRGVGHWLAEIRGAPEGSAGYVSALYFDPSRPAAGPVLARYGRHLQFEDSGVLLNIDSQAASKAQSGSSTNLSPGSSSAGASTAMFVVSAAGLPETQVLISER